MNTNLGRYKLLRVFIRESNWQLVNLMFCNGVLRSQIVMDNAGGLYRLASFFMGKGLAGKMVYNTFGRVYGGGQNVDELSQTISNLDRINVPTIINSCSYSHSKGQLSQQQLQQNAINYHMAGQIAARGLGKMFSVKISALINISVLEKYNRSMLLRDRIWVESSEGGRIRGDRLFDTFQKMYVGLAQQDFVEYLSVVHSYSGDPTEFQMDEIQFKMNHHPFYIYEPHKNDTLISKICFPLNKQEQKSMKAFVERLTFILDSAYSEQSKPKVMVEGEQFYIQNAIEDIYVQSEEKYNRERLFFVRTLQSYLLCSGKRLHLHMEIAKRYNLFFGGNLVAGGYKVFQSEYCQKNNKENPIQGDKIKVVGNLLGHLQQIVNSDLRGQIYFSGMNEKVLNNAISIKNNGKNNINMNFVIMHNMGQHLSNLLRKEGEKTYKLLPWGQSKRIVPYMLDRSSQLTEMNLPLKTQSKLLRHELVSRFLGY